MEFPAGTTKLEVTFKAEVHLEERPHGLRAVSYGPLVFSLPVSARWEKREYEKNGVPRIFPYCDYDIYPTEDWNYAFDSTEFLVEEKDIADIPFSESMPPVTVRARFRRISWGTEDGYPDVCAKIPESRIPYGETESLVMIPYGCTTLRMTEMPLTDTTK